MALSSREIAELRKIISIAQKLLAKATTEPKGGRTKIARSTTNTSHSSRRRGRDLAAFRKAIVAERKRGVPVVEIARKHGITPSYIYQIR
jgi:transposase-like protein